MSAAGPWSGRRKSLSGEDPVWVSAVMNNILLCKLPIAELKYVKSALKVVNVAGGEIVYKQDDAANDAYIVKFGKFIAKERRPGGEP